MRAISVGGIHSAITYVYKSPGTMGGVRLVCRRNQVSPRPPKPYPGGSGTGDGAWLASTPFMLADLVNDGRAQKVLIGVASNADVADVAGGVLSAVEEYTTVHVSEEDAASVADGMGLPLIIISGGPDDGVYPTVYRLSPRVCLSDA